MTKKDLEVPSPPASPTLEENDTTEEAHMMDVVEDHYETAVPVDSLGARSPGAESFRSVDLSHSPSHNEIRVDGNHVSVINQYFSPFSSLSFTDQIAFLLAFSLIVLIQSSVNCSTKKYECEGSNAFAVASSTLSLVGCLWGMYKEMNREMTDKQRMVFSLAMVFWWKLMMIFLTFFGPFSSVSYANGFVGVWGGFLVSVLMLNSRNDLFRATLVKLENGIYHRPAMYVLVASVFELFASIPFCVSDCSPFSAFAIALGTVSLIVVLVLIVVMSRIHVRIIRHVAVFLCVWWVVGGMVVTFVGPFNTVGNGYIGVVGGIVASVLLLMSKEEAPPQPSLRGEDDVV